VASALVLWCWILFFFNFSASPILSHITNNLGSNSGKTFFYEIQDGGPLKIEKECPAPQH
jgi:hypothetical protein